MVRVLEKRLGALPVVAEFGAGWIAEIVDELCPVRPVAWISHGEVMEALVANRLAPRRRRRVQISWTFLLCCFWCPIVKLALVIRWAYLAEPTLFPDVIVISLDVVEHGGPDLARVAPHVLIDQLLLDRRIERFRRRVVIAYAGVPDRRDNTLGEKAVAVPSRGILGTAVMVRHKLAYAYSRPAGSQRIIQGLEHQVRAHVVIHGPADDLIRAHVDKRRQVRETRIRPDIGISPTHSWSGSGAVNWRSTRSTRPPIALLSCTVVRADGPG